MVCLLLVMLAMLPQAFAANETAIMVGRVYTIEGDLLRYVPQERDWVPMVKDAPFGEEDILFSGKQGKAEMTVPSGTWIRIGDHTQIQFVTLDSDLSEIDVTEGVARFYNRGSEIVIKATSPFGYVLADTGTIFDFYVGENSVEVIAVKGTVSFVHTATDTRYDVAAGSPSILADASQVSSGDGTIDPDWNRWNRTRENFWAAKARARGRSDEYLPPELRDESYALEENGIWESVYYEGSSRWFWRPTTVSTGWSPFTAGRWTEWNGDQVWIPAEPFGYVTHHYGNWIYTRNSWYWAPPVVKVRVGVPLLDIGFFWFPGRVFWIHHNTYVGWVPLAPRETYYSHRHWGGRHNVVVTGNISRINVNIGSHAYARQAIVVPRDNFYRVNNYRNVRVPRTNATTIINNYKAVPVINDTVIRNYTTDRQRYTFTSTVAKEKPHNTVINRIEQNAPAIQRGRKENAVVVREQVRRAKEGKVNREARIETPKSISHIVPANEVNRPKSEIKFQPRDIKTGGKALPQVQPLRSREPEHGIPAMTNQPRQPSLPSRPHTTIPGLQTQRQEQKQEQVRQQQLQQQQRQEDQRRAQEQGRQQQLQQQQRQEQQRRAQEQGRQQQLQQQQRQEEQRRAQEQAKQQQILQQQRQEEQRRAQEQGRQQQLQQQQRQEEQRRAQEQGKQQQLQHQQRQEDQRRAQEQGRQQQLQQQQRQEDQRRAQEQGRQQQLLQQQRQEDQRRAQEQGRQQQLLQQQRQEDQRRAQEQGRQQQLLQQQRQEEQRRAQEQAKQQQLQQQQRQEEQRRAQEQVRQQQLLQQRQQQRQEQRRGAQGQEQLRKLCQQNPNNPICK